MSAYPAYNYDSTARKLNRIPERPFEVVPGGRRNPEQDSASSTVMLFAKIVIICIVAFAILGAVRITLSSATVALSLETKQLDSQIEDARDFGGLLEVEQSKLYNPTRIKSEADKIGMVTPASTTFIDISDDIVETDQSGALSLSASVEAASAQATGQAQ